MFSSPFPPSGFHTAHKKLLSLELAGGGGVGGVSGGQGEQRTQDWSGREEIISKCLAFFSVMILRR